MEAETRNIAANGLCDLFPIVHSFPVGRGDCRFAISFNQPNSGMTRTENKFALTAFSSRPSSTSCLHSATIVSRFGGGD